MSGTCGAQDRALVPSPDGGEDVHPTCTLLLDHPGRFHQEWRDGELWAEWSGRRDVHPYRVPAANEVATSSLVCPHVLTFIDDRCPICDR